MPEVVLYHHTQGLTTGVVAFAQTLRDAGHTVHLPDLFDGRTFATVKEGVAYASKIGFTAILDRGVDYAASLPTDLVCLGLSLGVMPAQKLAQTRPGARGAVLCYACLPVTEFGETWPAGVPVEIHGMDADEFFAEEGGDIDAARELVSATPDAELFLYSGSGHLFGDNSVSDHDPEAAQLMTERILAFLAKV